MKPTLIACISKRTIWQAVLLRSALIALLLATFAHAQELSLARISDRTMEIRLGPANAEPPPSPMIVDFPREEKWRGPIENAPATVESGDLRVEQLTCELVCQSHGPA